MTLCSVEVRAEGADETSPPQTSDPFSINPFGAADDESDLPAEARQGRAAELADQGRRAFDEHRLEEAARLLEQAYRLGAEAEVLYHLALSLHGLGHYDAAEERLRRYMEEVELDPGQRYTLQLQLQGFQRQFSRVTITSVPPGAQVLLGGQEVATTPQEEPLILPNGEYQLELRLEGHTPVQRTLTVPGGEPVNLEVELEPEALARARQRRDRALSASLWTLVALTAASAVATTALGAVTLERGNDYQASDDPLLDGHGSVRRLERASAGMTGVWITLGVSALIVEIIRLAQRPSREEP